MSINKRAASVRWTSAKIRKALLHPKPSGAIARHRDLTYGLMPGKQPRLSTDILAHIAEHADFLNGPTPKTPGLFDCVGWLLVPVPAWLLDALESLDAESEEREPDEDQEDAGDFEQIDEELEDVGDDEEEELGDDGDLEPNITTPATMGRPLTLDLEKMTVRVFNSEG